MAVYRERIERAVQPLLADSFTAGKVLEVAQNFGDTEVVLISSSVEVRFTSDRGQTLVEVALPDSQTGWYDLSRILTVLGLRSTPGPWNTPDEGEVAFRKHQPVIEQFLRDESCVSKLVARR
jgi:hypothetical protein